VRPSVESLRPASRPSPTRGALALAAASLVLLAGCGAAPSAPAAPPGPPPPQPLPVPEYQSLLTTVDQTVPPVIERIAAATTTDEITAARAELAQNAELQADALEPVLPPVAAESAHNDLVDYLQTVTTVDDLPVETPQANECGVLPGQEQQAYQAKADTQQILAGASTGLDATAFTGAGLTFTGRLTFDQPQPPAEQNRRADNGTVVQRSGSRGQGQLVVENGGASDAVIAAVAGDPANPLASIYVQANSTATLTGIRGDYEVYFKSGTDWDEQALKFTRDCQFQKFDDLFDSGSDWEISITPSVGGNASTSGTGPF
jgi:hypothetical protein